LVIWVFGIVPARILKYKISSEFYHWNMALWRFAKWRSSAILNFQFDSCGIWWWLLSDFASIYKMFENLQNPAELWQKTTFYNMASVRHLELKVFSFGQTISVIVLIHSSVQTFIKTWWYFTEIWRYNDFQDGGRPPC